MPRAEFLGTLVFLFVVITNIVYRGACVPPLQRSPCNSV